MKREIKFRAWDKQENKMITNGCLGGGSGAQLIVIEWEGGLSLANAYGLPDGTNPTFDSPVTERFELLEYTGLKDKNGKEIYEGDIVQFLYKNPESLEMLQPVECEIFWSSGGAWCLKWFDKSRYENGARLNPEKYEIIGNIYENQNLLKS